MLSRRTVHFVIFSILFLGAFFLAVVLGTWQLQRLEYKETLIATLEENYSKDIAQAATLKSFGALLDYQRVEIQGVPLVEETFYMFAAGETKNGKTGYRQIVPVRVSDGGIVLIDNGWVETQASTVDATQMVLQGVLMPVSPPNQFTPKNDPANAVWYWLDIGVIGDVLQTAVAPRYVRSLPQEALGDVAFLKESRIVKLYNPHLQYAITWYSLAIIALVIYGLVAVRRLRRI